MARKAHGQRGGIGAVMTVMAAPALMATIAASYTAFWFYNVESLKTNLANFAKAQRQAGNEATYTYDAASGFPWRIAVDLTNVRIGMTNAGQKWELQTPHLTLSSGVFSPRAVMAALPDEARLDVENARGKHYLSKTKGEVDFKVTTDSTDTIRLLAIEAKDFEATGYWNGRVMSSPLSLENGSATLTVDPPSAGDDDKQPFARLKVALRNWQWPTNVTYVLGKDLDSFDLSAKLHGVIDREIDLQQALTLWRDDGGKVEVNRFAMTWGESKVGGYGTLVMDDNLQPAANLTARVKGFTKVVDVLDQAHLIRPSDATMARLVIGRQLPRSGTGNLSLSLNNGRIYLGPLVLTKVPLLDWEEEGQQKAKSAAGGQLLEPGFEIGRDGQILR